MSDVMLQKKFADVQGVIGTLPDFVSARRFHAVHRSARWRATVAYTLLITHLAFVPLVLLSLSRWAFSGIAVACEP